jgi:ectoine hydroxylase-related dioxygenase (phytanoyl-CoA dioxygenase family)
MAVSKTPIDALDRDGYVVVPGAVPLAETDQVVVELTATLSGQHDDSVAIQTRDGVVYAARNVLEFFPPAREAWRTPGLLALLAEVLGPECGLVRVLYFDKPPDQTWSLAWHRDQAIAVKDNQLPSTTFTKPTRKAGVAHVNAPWSLLQNMLTLRLHLDDVTDENGPLRVLPGSHRSEGDTAADIDSAETILARRGDVLAMRPLLSHASGKSVAGTTRHRRILHFEFAAQRELPDGYQWQTFLPL